MRKLYALLAMVSVLAVAPAAAQQVDVSSGSVVETVAKLHPGEFVWAPQVAPAGPMLLIVNVTSQRAVLYRNGVPIGASTVSTGRAGHETPTGVFSILEKHVEHYSSKYDNAPMPFMQRLTWQGVALHAGNLPGYPASHGCIRLPAPFARLLYGVTKLGMTVAITDWAVTPRVAPTPEIVLNAAPAATLPGRAVDWHPERSAEGPVSIVVSATDRQAIVLRNGVVIGSGPVSVDGPVSGTWAYTLQSVDPAGQHWTRLELSAPGVESGQVPAQEWQRFHAPEEFRRAVAAIVAPGTTVIVTPDSVKPGGTPFSIIEEEGPAKP